MFLNPMPTHRFVKKVIKNLLIGILIMMTSLFIGMLGYHFLEGQSWVNAFENAAMILSGMGPVEPVNTTSGKIFAGTYAIFSGTVFLVVIAIIFAPVVHRFFHRFHMEER